MSLASVHHAKLHVSLRLPSNRAIAQLWCEALHLEIKNLKKSSVICSDHFWPHHIFRSGCRTIISKGALPVLAFHDESLSDAISGLNDASSSSTMTAPESLLEIQNYRRKVLPKKRSSRILDLPSATGNISLKSNLSSVTKESIKSSLTLTAPEVSMEIRSSSSTITEPEALMEIQNHHSKILPKKRCRTSRFTTLDSPSTTRNVRPKSNQSSLTKDSISVSSSTRSSQVTTKKRKTEWDKNQLKKNSNSLNLLDELIPPRWLSNHTVAATPQDTQVTQDIDAPEREFRTCFTCGVTWYDDHVSLDCSECGGYALERPCPECDGNCGAKWERDLAKSHGYQKAYWLGNCRRAPSSPSAPQHSKKDDEQKTTDASEGLSMSLDKLTVKNS